MFTVDQIKVAHAKVKSGADFPAYIQELIALGVRRYESFVSDGHIIYEGENNFKTQADAKYPSMLVAEVCNTPQFRKGLKEHQEGKTNYLTFCEISARLGVEKWNVDLMKMTCIYYDKSGNEILTETIGKVR